MNRDIQARTYEIFRYELEATSSPACFFISLMPFSCTQRIIRLLRPPVLYLQRLVPLISDFWQGCLNTFVPNATFLYPLKASESLTVFYVFRGQRKGGLGTNGLIIQCIIVGSLECVVMPTAIYPWLPRDRSKELNQKSTHLLKVSELKGLIQHDLRIFVR